MQVTQTNADGLKREFKVVVPAGQIEEMVTSRLVDMGKKAQLPGFRPGKAPLALLRKKYGGSVTGEVLETAVNEGTTKAIDDNALKPAMQPKIEVTAYGDGKDLEFTVAVETLPAIEPVDLASIAVERPVAEVPDEEIAKALGQLAERRKSSEKIEETRKAANGDVVLIDFLGKRGGEAFAGGSAEDFELVLGSGMFIPGFEEQLVGTEPGQDVVVRVTFPEAYGNKELAGQPVEFDVKVKELRRQVPAPVDDELAKGMGLDDLEALKKALREEFARDYASRSRAHAKRALLDVLAERHDFPVPQGMLDLEFGAIWKQVEKQKAEGQLDDEDKGKTDDELTAEYRAIAERRVRLGLLLSEVGQRANISVTQEDLNRALMNEARRFPGQEHLVFQYYQKNQDAMNSLRAPIYEDKVIDHILGLASVTDKPVPPAELMTEPGAEG